MKRLLALVFVSVALSLIASRLVTTTRFAAFRTWLEEPRAEAAAPETGRPPEEIPA